jgi:2'-5' RNA ligase
MPSYFLIIPFPDEVKDRLGAVQPRDLPGVSLAGRQEMHLTLYSLGELSPRYDEAIRKALAQVKASAFTITISGVGKFQLEGKPQVLWAGIESSPPLFALHHSIGTALIDAIGFKPEELPYAPHITLARLNSPAPPDAVERYLEDNQGFVVRSVLLDRFVLYSSVAVDGVPQYREEVVFPLLQPVLSTIPRMGTTLEQSRFVAYLGPAEIHDSVIEKVRHRNASLEVEIRGADGTLIAVQFHRIIEVQENRAEGMMLYALAEFRHRGGERLFVFANWENDDDAALSVIAEEVTFQACQDGG